MAFHGMPRQRPRQVLSVRQNPREVPRLILRHAEVCVSKSAHKPRHLFAALAAGAAAVSVAKTAALLVAGVGALGVATNVTIISATDPSMIHQHDTCHVFTATLAAVPVTVHAATLATAPYLPRYRNTLCGTCREPCHDICRGPRHRTCHGVCCDTYLSRAVPRYLSRHCRAKSRGTRDAIFHGTCGGACHGPCRGCCRGRCLWRVS